jgi:hypothetical protein
VLVGLNVIELTVKYDIFAELEHGFVPIQKNMNILGLLVKKK